MNNSNKDQAEQLNETAVISSSFRIFRTKQEEYWDIWCEDAIVFPKDKALGEVFTEHNLRKLISSYSGIEYKYEIEIRENETIVYIVSDNLDEEIRFEFVEMSSVLVL